MMMISDTKPRLLVHRTNLDEPQPLQTELRDSCSSRQLSLISKPQQSCLDYP